MVFKHYKCLIKKPGPCDERDNRRKLAVGVNIEQRRTMPTKRTRRIVAEISNPGPACVMIPPYIGPAVVDSKKRSAPSYSFGRKFGRRYDTFGPGPAEYDIHGLGAKGKVKPLAASLHSRRQSLRKILTPGPNAYSYKVAREAKRLIDNKPMYTFGHKFDMAKENIVPGPNVYKIPTAIGASKDGPIRSAPAYTMAGRIKPNMLGILNAPGPGSYDGNYLVMRKTQPSYSMRKLIKDPPDTRPGPGKYCPEKYVRHKSVPAPSFSIHHTPHLGLRKAYYMPVCPKKPGATWCE